MYFLTRKPFVFPLLFFVLVFVGHKCLAQEEKTATYKNSVATNLLLPFFESFDLGYERTIANKWAVGISGAVYGPRAEDLATDDSFFEYQTNYELMPFLRIYFQGAQNKSHFVEVFGSISQAEESGRLIRSVNTSGYGIYTQGTDQYTVGGLGAGYGYRFLFLQKRLVLEAQFGLRTNFDVDFIFLNVAAVRTGVKLGYRF